MTSFIHFTTLHPSLFSLPPPPTTSSPPHPPPLPYTLHASLCGQFLLLVYAVLCGEFILQLLIHPMLFYVGILSLILQLLIHPILFYMGSFSYTPRDVLCVEFLLHTRTVLCVEFLLHTPCCFMCGVSLSLTHPVLFYVGNLS